MPTSPNASCNLTVWTHGPHTHRLLPPASCLLYPSALTQSLNQPSSLSRPSCAKASCTGCTPTHHAPRTTRTTRTLLHELAPSLHQPARLSALTPNPRSSSQQPQSAVLA